MIIGSATIDNVEFTGRAEVCKLLLEMSYEAVIEFDEPEFPEIKGIRFITEEHKDEVRQVIQRLQKLFKSTVSNINAAKRQTKIFVPTRFDEDGFDGEEFHGIQFTINFYPGKYEYVTIDAEDKIVHENPRNPNAETLL